MHKFQPDEKDTHLLLAYTPTHYIPPYPWYINLTMLRNQGDVVLTVRAETNHKKEPREMGETSSVRFTREMWRQFVKDIEAANRIYEATDYLDSCM
jgi:hypothetical protein